MEHCGRRNMAPIPAALTIVGRHCGEGSHVLKWFGGMKSGVGAATGNSVARCWQEFTAIFSKNHGNLRTFHRQNFHTYGLLSDILTSTLSGIVWLVETAYLIVV